MAFDIAGALKAGYSSKEIADHLLNEPGFDVRAARRSGYSDDEIVQHLAQTPVAPSYQVPKVDLLNVNPFAEPTGRLQAPQGGVTLEPSVQGVPVRQMAPVEGSPTTTMMDRAQAIPGVRVVGGAIRGAYGVGQGVSNVVGAAAETLGFDRSGADQLRDEFGRRIEALDTEANRGLTRARNPLDPTPAVLPESWQQPYQNMNIAGGAGQVAPWMLGPTGGATAVGRIATNAATGAVAGYLTPQEGAYSGDAAQESAVWGAILGGSISGGIEGLTSAVNWLRQSATGKALLASVDPAKIPGMIQALRNADMPVKGYEPNAAQAAVAGGFDQPAFTGLQRDVFTTQNPTVAADVLAQRQSTSMAHADQLARAEAARAANAPTGAMAGAVDNVVAPPTAPLEDVSASIALSREQMQLDRDTLAAQVRGVRSNTAEEAARIKAEGAQRIGETETATAQRLAAEADSAKEAMRQVAAERARKLAEIEAKSTTTIATAQQETEQGLAQLDETQRGLSNAPERFQSEFGNALSEQAQQEYNAARKIVADKYDEAFKANRGVVTEMPATVSVVGRINDSQQVELSRELSTDTIRALRPFGLAETVDKAGDAGKKLGTVTLEQIDEAIHAVNRDIRTAERDSNLRPLLYSLREIRNALETDLRAAPFSPEGMQLYDAAVQSWKERILPRFRTGEVNTRMFETSLRNTDPIAPEALVGRYMRNESSAREFVALFRNTEGEMNPQAAQTMREGIEDLFTREVEKGVDGFNPTAANKWLQTNRDQLRVLEEVIPGIRQELTDFSQAARRVVQTRTELENGLKAVQAQVKQDTRTLTAKVNAETRGELARLREQATASANSLRAELASQKTAIGQTSEQRLAEVQRRAEADRSVLADAERKARAALDEQKKLEALLNFKDSADMARKTVENPQVRAEVLHRLSSAGRRALAQRVIWDVNNAGTGAERLAHLSAREGAIREVLRAAYPQTVDDLVDGMRAEATQAAQMEARTASQGNARAQLDARFNAARSQIGDTPVAGENRAAYERAKAELTAGATPEQLSSLADLERDLSIQRQLEAHLGNVPGQRAGISTATKLAENHGLAYVPTTGAGTVNLALRIFRIMKGEMTREQADELARIMLKPGATADALERAAARQAQGQAIDAVGVAGARAATATSAQQNRNSQ